jgi:hypothetical protein
MRAVTAAMKRRRFSLKTFLSTIDGGRKELTLPKKQMVFSQGDSADPVLYVQKGKVKLSVVAKRGKEATIGVLNEGDFFGEGCLTGQPLRMCSATAMTDCTVMRIDKKSMMEVIHSETCVLRYVRRIFADGTFATKRIWLISFSILGTKDWLPFFCCWLTSARTGSRKLRFPRSVRRVWQRWWAQLVGGSIFS